MNYFRTYAWHVVLGIFFVALVAYGALFLESRGQLLWSVSGFDFMLMALAITRLVPRPGDPNAPDAVDWDGVYQAVGGEGIAGPLLFVAMMCEYGSAGFRNQKIWMIKSQRELTGLGLYESKMCVERTVADLDRPGLPASVRQRVVRDFFSNRAELPPQIVAMVGHRLGWVRWAGLELADAWGLTPEQVRELTAERVWDASPRVRERALRMSRG